MTVSNPPTTAPSSAPTTETASLGERNFLLVCISHVLGYFSNSITGPTLPLFLVAQGHGEFFVGGVLATFSASSFSVRLLVGHLVDAGHVRSTLRSAGFFLGLAPLAYLIPVLPVLFVTRMVHGLGWACLNVAGSAWTGMLVPAARRAEALGYFTMAQKIGATAAQVLGLWLAARLGFEAVFLLSAAVGLLIVLNVHFTNDTQMALRADRGPVDLQTLFDPKKLLAVERGALLGTSVLALMMMAGAATVGFMPLYFKFLGLEGVEWYFLAIGVTGIGARAVIGPWADRLGRLRSVSLGLLLQFGGIALLGTAPGFWGMIIAGVVHTAGNAMSEPSLYALAIDRSAANRRGAAMATYTSGFQLGGGIGSFTSGFLIERLGYQAMYRMSVIPLLAALSILAVQWRNLRATTPA